MAEETKTSPTPKPKVVKPVKDVEVEEIEVVTEPTKEVVEPVEVIKEESTEDDVEAMGKRGRKSKAQIAEEHRRTREDIESNYANLIAHEPAKADLFREELRIVLKNLGL